MGNPKVSIIVPVYNAESAVNLLIEDILRQTESSFEVIIVDDGSTDATKMVVDRYVHKDNRVKLVSQKNGGPSAARNTGISVATSAYCMFFDADDRIDQQMVEKMLQDVRTDSIDMIECGALLRTIDMNGNITEDRELLPTVFKGSSKVRVLKSLARNGLFHSVWNKIYNTEVLLDNNIRFDTAVKNGEDLIFNLSYMKHVNQYRTVPFSLYIYQRVDASQSITSQKNVAKNIFTYRRAMYKSLRDYVGNGHIGLLLIVRARWFVSSLKAVVASAGAGVQR